MSESPNGYQCLRAAFYRAAPRPDTPSPDSDAAPLPGRPLIRWAHVVICCPNILPGGGDSCSCGRSQWFSYTSRAEMRDSSWGLTCGAPGCWLKVKSEYLLFIYLCIYFVKRKVTSCLDSHNPRSVVCILTRWSFKFLFHKSQCLSFLHYF